MTDQPVLSVPDPAAIRDELQRLVLADLLGPLGGEHEEFQREDPLDRYPLGRLAPRGVEVTFVGYFNSLRDLGGMRRRVEDDVSTRLTRADARGLARRFDPTLEELTSRRSSDQIRPLLDQLAVAFTGRRPAGAARPRPAWCSPC